LGVLLIGSVSATWIKVSLSDSFSDSEINNTLWYNESTPSGAVIEYNGNITIGIGATIPSYLITKYDYNTSTSWKITFNLSYDSTGEYFIAVCNKTIGLVWGDLAGGTSCPIGSASVGIYYTNVVGLLKVQKYIIINGTTRVITLYNWDNTVNGTVNYSLTPLKSNMYLLFGVHNGNNMSLFNFDVYRDSNETFFPTLNVNLTYPLNNSLFSNSSIKFISNYTLTNMNATTNATYWIYNNTGILNKTTLTISSAQNGSELNMNDFTIGNYKWNVYVCGFNLTNETICSWGSAGNFSFDVAGQLVNENYSQQTFETASEQFQINFSLFPGSNLISVYLNYDGTPYIISDITNYGTSIELKKTIDISLNTNYYANQTKQFYWSFVFSNGGLIRQNTSAKNQTVFPLIINYCNATYRMNSLNFTTYDETNPNPKINATFHTAWNFWKGSGSIKKSYAFEDTSGTNSSFKICIHPNQSVIKTDLAMEITSTGYWARTYYLSNATLTNATQEIPLRMINDTIGVKFFHTVRSGVARVIGANVIISKYDVGLGIWVVVGIRQSDSQGEFVEYLELDKSYTYSITKNGNFLGNIEKTSTCSATPCTVNLDIESAAINLWEGYYDAWASNVVYTLAYDTATKNVTFTFVDTTGLANYFHLTVNKVSANQTGTILCEKSLYATVGTIICGLGGETGQFVAKGYISRSPETLVATLYGILSAIAETIGKNEGLFFTLLIVVVVGLIGAFNPVVGILLAGLAFIFAGIMGFIMISVTAMILVFILFVILMIKMGRQNV
jgi:hypothetical protein